MQTQYLGRYSCIEICAVHRAAYNMVYSFADVGSGTRGIFNIRCSTLYSHPSLQSHSASAAGWGCAAQHGGGTDQREDAELVHKEVSMHGTLQLLIYLCMDTTCTCLLEPTKGSSILANPARCI